MPRLNVILVLLLVVCALSVVTARHQARKLFVQLQAVEKETRRLNVEWGRLQLEQSTWATYARIEQIARNDLRMSVPELTQVRVLGLAGAGP